MSDIDRGLAINQRFDNHPFKEGLLRILSQHFSPTIAQRFGVILEVEMYNKKLNAVGKQIKDQKFMAELWYKGSSGIAQYVCDVFSDWPKAQCEAQMLRFITDKMIKGELGNDWFLSKSGQISLDVKTRKFETKEEVTND